MGTSKANPGTASPEWRKARRRAGVWARAGGGGEGVGVGDVVAAAAAALGSSPLFGAAGQESTRRLGGVLAGFGTDGVDPTLERLGLGHLVGKSGLDLLAGLLEYVAGSGSSVDDAAVQNAVRELLDDMSDEGLLDGDVVIDAHTAADLLLRYFAYYLTGRVLFFLADRLENASPGEQAARREMEIGDYVLAQLRAQMAGASVTDVDWSGAEGAEILGRLSQQVLEVFGDSEDGEE